MSMMTSQILVFKDSRKTQKPKYYENKTLFFLQIEKSVHYLLRDKSCQKIVF